MAMNLFKGLVALGIMGILLLGSGFSPLNVQLVSVLVLSGLIGIFLGDTLYFMALVRLGPRIALLLGTLIPITAALMAIVLLGERISMTASLGIVLTLTGVGYVLWERAPDQSRSHQWRSGLLLGLAFVLANAMGIILTKIGVENVSAMEASFIRSLSALAGLLTWGMATAALGRWVAPLKNKRLLVLLLFASFIGAFLGTWLSVVALKYTDAAVAATLNSTSPIFVLPLAAILLKEKISLRAVTGACLAIAGIGVYFISLQ